MKKLLIVDGSNLLFQMYYGMPARIKNQQGRSVHGVIGFVGALLKILRMTGPDYAAVLFDGECANERTVLDEDYKTNRTDYSILPEEDTPFSQLPDIFKALDLLHIRYGETWECETDDWVCSYTRQYGADMQITIASQDSDFFQLITDSVRVLRYRGEKTVICDVEYIYTKLGILPGQYAAFKALTGDPSDNIRGAEKIGPKTAAALLGQFGDLDTLLSCADTIRKPSVRESVIQNAQRIRKNYQLIHLTGDHKVPFSISELAYTQSNATTRTVLEQCGILP